MQKNKHNHKHEHAELQPSRCQAGGGGEEATHRVFTFSYRAAACDADYGSGSKQRTSVTCSRSAPPERSPRRQRALLGSWEYSGCGDKPCPGGTKLDIAPSPWTVSRTIIAGIWVAFFRECQQ